ncbi:MAG TPA: CpsD/CapB family tyrosine-protein kinase [Candidatus Solibacter sp.]|nr:CpsD/CapB family tyrosine-protein kinase [Candidatus Solibacter sp.]
MSRIFDALQRSGTEQSGVEYPDVVSMATAVFEAPRLPNFDQSPIEEPAEGIPSVLLPAGVPETGVPSDVHASPTLFPSLEVSLAPSSRLVFFTQPESLAAEKFRFLGVRLRHMRQNRPLKKVLVTSTIPEEGKSLIASNLAGALAQRREKERVLLIEGDLRRPVLAGQFGLGRLAGLSEWLESGVDTATNIYHLNAPGFWIMPGGAPPANSLELMQSGKLSALMNQMAPLFDWIIVDSPPLLPLADTTIWSRLTDGTILVTREGKTQKTQLQRGLEMIKKSNLLGVVLNSCTDEDQDNYYRRYSPATK